MTSLHLINWSARNVRVAKTKTLKLMVNYLPSFTCEYSVPYSIYISYLQIPPSEDLQSTRVSNNREWKRCESDK